MGEKNGSPDGSNIEDVRAAKPRATRLFKKFGTLAGIGITRHGNGYGLKINLSKTPATSDTFPTEVNGVPVEIEVVGPIRKQGVKARPN